MTVETTPSKRRRRRRRRPKSAALSARTIVEVRARKREFLKQVSGLLTEALGFQVRVSLVAPNRMEGFTPDMRRAARMTRKQARRQMADAFAPLTPAAVERPAPLAPVEAPATLAQLAPGDTLEIPPHLKRQMSRDLTSVIAGMMAEGEKPKRKRAKRRKTTDLNDEVGI